MNIHTQNYFWELHSHACSDIFSTFGDPLDRMVNGKGFLNQDFNFMQTYTINLSGSLTSRTSDERYPINTYGTIDKVQIYQCEREKCSITCDSYKEKPYKITF